MHLQQAISEQHAAFAGVIAADTPGFQFAVPGAALLFEDVAGDGTCWRDAEGAFEVDRAIEVTPTGLVIRTKITSLAQTPTPRLTGIEPLSLGLAVDPQQWIHHHCKGGVTDWWVPPQAYRTQVTYGLGHALYLQSHGAGRSTNEDMPLVISIAEPLKAGLFFSMEWSGEWVLSMKAGDDQRVTAALGFKASLALEPGETFELPVVHLGFFDGGFDAGTNALRRHLYERVCPGYQGRPETPRVSYDSWFGIEDRNTCELLKKQADRAAAAGVEVFVQDASWFVGGFAGGVGNWDVVDEEKYPGGLEELADYVRSKGMDFGLWIELERAVPGTSAVTQHPELFEDCDQWSSQPFGGAAGRQHHLNLALPAAQDWMIQTIAGLIERYDVRWSRFDYNLEPNPFWKRVDPTGNIQFRYMQGLYRVLDTLMERYPQWRVETCASGGRRLDLGMIRRAHTAWFSDHTDDPAVCRHMQARANRFLPGHLLNSSVAVRLGRGDAGFDDTAFLSRMLGKLAFDGDIASWSPKLTERARHWSDVFKSIRHLMPQDFHQLTAAPAAADDWDVMSFNAYDSREAALYAFAGRAAGEQTIRLRGLREDALYTLTCQNDRMHVQQPGASLMQEGFTISLEANAAKLWRVEME